jgi:hypothetical protein
VTLVDSTGRAIADNQLPPSVLATQSDLSSLPEVQAALAGRTGVDIPIRRRAGPDLGRGTGAPVVRVASDLAVLERAAGRSQRASSSARSSRLASAACWRCSAGA